MAASVIFRETQVETEAAPHCHHNVHSLPSDNSGVDVDNSSSGAGGPKPISRFGNLAEHVRTLGASTPLTVTANIRALETVSLMPNSLPRKTQRSIKRKNSSKKF